MARHIIYIPGIGDHHSYGQDIAIQLWRLFGLTPHYLPLGWNKPEGFDVKQRRILELVDRLQSKNNSVSLVGVSAGASAVLNAFAHSNKITKVICISGKINNPQTIGEKVFVVNPDFGQSMSNLSKSLAGLGAKKSKILSIHPWRDQTVPIADTRIQGTKELTLPGRNHATGIFIGVILGSYSIAKFVRSK
jgi:pimeloyl-ACP methyl ester carboxylesterase